jgi:nitronate monooxygenase
MSGQETVDVLTDADASPTGFPFKVLSLAGSMSDASEYERRRRTCDLGYLRHIYKRGDGSLGRRCPAEPVEAFVRKDGDQADTCGRKCVCNGLLANVGLGQIRRQGGVEKPLVTSGDDARNVARFLATPQAKSYSARDVVVYLLSAMEARRLAAS